MEAPWGAMFEVTTSDDEVVFKRIVTFGRLLRPHPLGCWVCKRLRFYTTRCFLPDVSLPDLVPGSHALQLLPRLLC